MYSMGLSKILKGPRRYSGIRENVIHVQKRTHIVSEIEFYILDHNISSCQNPGFLACWDVLVQYVERSLRKIPACFLKWCVYRLLRRLQMAVPGGGVMVLERITACIALEQI